MNSEKLLINIVKKPKIKTGAMEQNRCSLTIRNIFNAIDIILFSALFGYRNIGMIQLKMNVLLVQL